jgi:hypothetical protein
MTTQRLLYGSVALAAATATLLATVLRDGTPAPSAGATARADRLCLAGHAKLAALPPMNDVQGIATAGPQVVAITLQSARDLLAIDAPADQAKSIRRYARHLIRQADLTTRLQRAARRYDRAAAIDLINKITANSRLGKRVGRTIAPACGSSTVDRTTDAPATGVAV